MEGGRTEQQRRQPHGLEERPSGKEPVFVFLTRHPWGFRRACRCLHARAFLLRVYTDPPATRKSTTPGYRVDAYLQLLVDKCHF